MAVLPRRVWCALGVLIALTGCGRVGVELLGMAPAVDGAVDGGSQDGCAVACVNEHGSAECRDGQCLLQCANGYRDCDGVAANGCETSIAASPASCGQCGIVCENANGTTACSDGLCLPSCPPGAFGDCDGNPQNGCEADLRVPGRCGRCDQRCENAHGGTACVDGVCAPSCVDGYADCDGDARNGCETQLATDPLHCGRCDAACDVSYQVCVDRACQMSPCASGRGDCDGDPSACETELTSSVAHCGFCGNACSLSHASARCADGRCVVESCEAGYADCDGNPQNGCEAALASDVSHCGACTNACANAHGATRCSGSSCVASCATGYGDCDDNRQNGCETPLDSVTHCGVCGRTCSTTVSNGVPACNAGVCGTVCGDLGGVYALKMLVPTTWPAAEFLSSGSGTFTYWARLTLTQSGTSLSGSVVMCGRIVPDFSASPLIGERYGVVQPDALFDSALPVQAVSGSLSALSPGATLTLARTALYAGLRLTDPVNDAWPSLSQVSAVDHDADGNLGITEPYKSGGGYSQPPVSASLFGPRAVRGYFADRLRFGLSATLRDCASADGGLTTPSFDKRTLGCLLTSGSACSQTQAQYLDSHAPNFQAQASTHSLRRLGPTGSSFSCAQIRAALP